MRQGRPPVPQIGAGVVSRTIRIPLSRGLFALIDAADLPLVKGWSWYADPSKRGQDKMYAKTSMWNGKRSVKIRMHRLLLGAAPGQLVDHRNGDGLDNRRSNLRFCTSCQNSANRRPRGNKFRGVSRMDGRFGARIVHNGERFYLGRFDSAVDAANAYDEAARRLNGEFAVLNFPGYANAA